MSSNDTKKEKFLEAYDKYADAIFRYCCFKIGNREKAKDFMQETFMKTWLYYKDKDIKYIKAFLYKTAKGVIIDYLRKRKETSLESLMEQNMQFGENTLASIQEKIDAQNIIRLIKDLPKKYEDVIILRYLEELSPKEIALITGLPENTISVRINRGIEKLRKLIIQQENQYAFKRLQKAGRVV